jgi:hypothetical protein
MSDEYYYKIGTSKIDTNKLIALAKEDSSWTEYYEFKVKKVPDELLKDDFFIAWLRKKYNVGFGVLKIRANSCYPWHRDGMRCTAINMLLTLDSHSHCVFNTEAKNSSFTHGIIDLPYEPSTFYAFNTTIPHEVINFGGDRYLLSTEFMGKDVGLTYQQLVASIKSNYKRGI